MFIVLIMKVSGMMIEISRVVAMDKKLVEALETIKAECKQHRTCKDCVLWLGYACFLHMPYPCNWDIKDLEA